VALSQFDLDRVAGRDPRWRGSGCGSAFGGVGAPGEIGVLSIDIGGNDYWVWAAITVVDPVVVIIEYNYRFGNERALTIPYRPDFVRQEVHHSMVYAGVSLPTLAKLADQKGYALVGTNSNGNSAIFVKKDALPAGIKRLTAQEAFVPDKFREARDPDSNQRDISRQEEIAILAELPVVDLDD
jgi:hypothetical protein